VEEIMSTHNATRAIEQDEGSHETAALERIAAALRGLRFGAVTVVVHEGVVVRIEKT
jgi:hypothetical protein